MQAITQEEYQAREAQALYHMKCCPELAIVIQKGPEIYKDRALALLVLRLIEHFVCSYRASRKRQCYCNKCKACLARRDRAVRATYKDLWDCQSLCIALRHAGLLEEESLALLTKDLVLIHVQLVQITKKFQSIESRRLILKKARGPSFSTFLSFIANPDNMDCPLLQGPLRILSVVPKQ